MRILNIIICFFAISTLAQAADINSIALVLTTPAQPSKPSLVTRCMATASSIFAGMRRILTPSAKARIAPESRYTTSLMAAVIAHDHVEFNELLNSNPALINIQDIDGMTALMHAAKNENVRALTALIAAGADLERVSKVAKFTALHFVAQEATYDGIFALIVAGAAVNIQDCNGNTPLMLAISSIKRPRERYKRGAVFIVDDIDLNRRNKKGQSALWLAEQMRSQRLVALLKAQGADEKICDNEGTSPTEIAQRAALAEKVTADFLEKKFGCTLNHSRTQGN